MYFFDALSTFNGVILVVLGMNVVRKAAKEVNNFQHHHRSQFRILTLVAINVLLTYLSGFLIAMIHLNDDTGFELGVATAMIESAVSCVLCILICIRIRQNRLRSVNKQTPGNFVPVTVNVFQTPN